MAIQSRAELTMSKPFDFDFQSVERVLIIKFSALGDIVQAMGAVQDVRNNFPHAKISVLTTPPYPKLWRRCPWVDEILEDTRGKGGHIKKLKNWLHQRRHLPARNFDVVIDLQNTDRTVGYRRAFLSKPSWSYIPRPRSDGTSLPKKLPSLERMEKQLLQSGLELQHVGKPDIEWMVNDVSALLQEAGVSRPMITLVPGCSPEHPDKMWPHFAPLAEQLIADGFDVVTVPGPDAAEQDLCKSIPGIVLTGGSFLDYFDLAGVLARSEFVIGNDTGPMHMASHLGRPGLALYGPHASAESTSIESRNIVALSSSDLGRLTVEKVLNRAREMMGAQ